MAITSWKFWLVTVLYLIGGGLIIWACRYEPPAPRNPRRSMRTDLNFLKTPLGTFFLDVGDYPTTEQGLLALVQRPTGLTDWNGPYIPDSMINDLLHDPWGRLYIYQRTGTVVTIRSRGSSRDTNEDDIELRVFDD